MSTFHAASMPRGLTELQRFGADSSSFLALHADNEHFALPGCDGFVSYRRRGRLRIQFGGPVCAEEDKDRLLAGFLADSAARRHRVIALQLSAPDAAHQEARGFRVNQMGSSYSIHLPEFSMRGQRMVKTRNMVSRAARDGSAVHEVTDAAERASIAGELDAIDAEWLRDKGRLARQLGFLVGTRNDGLDGHRRLFVAVADGRIVAYVTYSPVHGREPGRLYDLTRRRPDAPRGLVEQIFAYAAETMRDEGVEWLHMGFTPFVDVEPEHRLPSAQPATARVVELTRRHGHALYASESQRAFKMKWRPQRVTPEYMASRRALGPTDLWRLLRVVGAV